LAATIAVSGAGGIRKSAAQPRLAPGQVWSIKSASQSSAKIVIGRIDPWNDKIVVHVSVMDLTVPQGLPGAGRPTRIDHMPFEEGAVVESIDRLVATGAMPAPDFESGYRQWLDRGDVLARRRRLPCQGKSGRQPIPRGKRPAARVSFR
jgi:hypothetical protein